MCVNAALEAAGENVDDMLEGRKWWSEDTVGWMEGNDEVIVVSVTDALQFGLSLLCNFSS
jgi:hypothetical protein